MTRLDRPLDNPLNWSFPLGRLCGIVIRVHVTFLMCAVILIWMETPKDDWSDTRSAFALLGDALGTYGLLFLIVLLHEFGHCFGARYVGGDAEEILLWPLGGLALTSVPHHWLPRLITTAAGPMVNVVLCAMSSVALVAWTGSLASVPWNPLFPMSPLDESWLPTAGQAWLIRFYGISSFLLLINVIPVYPLDGGRILHALLWKRKGHRAALEMVTGAGMVGAILLFLFGLFTDQGWITLSIAVYAYFTCWQDRRMLRFQGDWTTDSFGFDNEFGNDSESVGPRRPGFFARRRIRRAARRAERRRLEEEQREAAVDAILRKVAEQGRGSLSARELRILELETQKLRSLDSPSDP
jgi:Zn-dependent protease